MPFPALMFAPLGLFLSALGYPMMRRKVPQNYFYGLRVPATLRDARVWYDANEVAGRDLFGIGLVVGAASVVLSLTGLPAEAQAGICGVLLAALTLAATVRGVRLAGRLEKTYANKA